MHSNKILSDNINSIMQYNQYLIKDLLDINFEEEIENVGIYKTELGNDSLYINYNKKNYFLHSVIDPIRDAERLIKNIDFNKHSIIVVFGLGLGYHLKKIKEKISPDTRVFVVEYNIEVLKYTLNNVDLSEIFDTPQFFLLFGDEKMLEYQIPLMFSYNFHNMSKNIQYITLPNYYLYDNKNIFVIKSINKKLLNDVITMGNSLEDMINGFVNNYINIDYIINSNSIEEIKNKYKDKPAIIVASGPSLEKNIKHLKNAENKALIIACDASLRACEKIGVKPDAIASIERDEPTYTYYYKDKKIDKDIVLVGPGVLWPKIFEEYKGKHIIMSKINEGIDRWWYEHFENIQYVNQGMSSATVAFAVAKEAGCSPIILIGQDLAYTNNKKHSDDTHTEYENKNEDVDVDANAVGGVIYVEDQQGKPIKTNIIYKIFKEWYEYQAIYSENTNIINATEGGANIKGIKNMKFSEAIKLYCKEEINFKLNDLLKDVVKTKDEKIAKYNILIEDIEKEVTSLEKIKEAASNHFEKLLEISNRLKENIEKITIEDILNEMRQGDDIVKDILYKYESLKDFFQQIITQTIIFVNALGNEPTIENIKRNLELQLNLMYMIKNSSDLIIGEYEKMKDFLMQKKEGI